MIHLDRRKAPAVKTFGHLMIPEMSTVKAPNGAVIHVLDDGECPLVRLTLISAGGKDECASHALATLAPLMLCEGSAHYDTLAVADLLDFHGATLSARAHEHHTRVDLTAMPAYMPVLIDLLADALTNPTVPECRLEAIKASLDAQCSYDYSRVDSIAGKEALRMIAGDGHQFVRFARPGDFLKPDVAAVREQLSRIFRADTLDVFVSGAVNDNIMKHVESLVAALPPEGGVSIHAPEFNPVPPGIRRVPMEGVCQCALQVMIPAVRRDHPDYIPLRLAVTALGGYFGSRLMQNIREDKGYTYGITASLCGQHEGSYVEISAECAPNYADALLEEVRHELLNMAARPLDDDALLRMRLFEQTRLAAVLDNAIATSDYYSSAITVGMPEKYFSKQEKVTASITSDEIAEVSARYLLPELMRVAVVGEITATGNEEYQAI